MEPFAARNEIGSLGFMTANVRNRLKISNCRFAENVFAAEPEGGAQNTLGDARCSAN